MSGNCPHPTTVAKFSDENTGARRKAAVCVSGRDLQAMNTGKG